MCTRGLTFGLMSIGAAGLSAAQNIDSRFDSFPTYAGEDLELAISQQGIKFSLWSPEADAVRVRIYPTDRNSDPLEIIDLTKGENGVWRAIASADHIGHFYTFQIAHRGKWLDETPGIWAKAVGTNGHRAAIVNLDDTDPIAWESDKGPKVESINDVVLYEMHHRDFSMHPSSGIVHKGKFLALTEQGTTTPSGDKTGIDHLKELGTYSPPTTTTASTKPISHPTNTTGDTTPTTTTRLKVHIRPTRPTPSLVSEK